MDADFSFRDASNPYASEGPHAFDDVVFDDALIQKYNRQGPRYTSYPTALEFAPMDAAAERAVLQNRDEKTELSLYVHIPFCRHLCYYCACNKIITKKNAASGDYLDYVYKEVDAKIHRLRGKKSVHQAHFGGGTPTFLSDDELVALWRFLRDRFDFAEDGDYSIEIDPRELRPDTLRVLRDLGFTRLSFGVQDLDRDVQIAVNRVQPPEQIEAVMDQARRLGFASVNIDLIYGLPKQNLSRAKNTVDRILKLAPDRLSLFNYAHLPERFAPQRRINEADLPSGAEKLAILKNAIFALTQAGYDYIGIDHFARPSDSLAKAKRQGVLHRNFQGYTTRGDLDLLGFGVSAISQIGDCILQNDSDQKTYQSKIASEGLAGSRFLRASLKDKVRRYAIVHLLCHDRLDFSDMNFRFGIDPISYFADELGVLADMQKDGLVAIDAKGVRVLPRGRLLGRNVAMVFDEYLGKKHDKRFSRVI